MCTWKRIDVAGVRPVAVLNSALHGIVLILLVPGWARAEAPLVSFDMTSVAACRDVTTEEFAAENPDERLLELKVEVSSILRRGDEDDLTEFLYRFSSQTVGPVVVDYSPKTCLSTDVVGNVGVEKKRETSQSLGINANSSVHQYLNGQLSGGANVGSKSNSQVRYELLPPLDSVSTSGTLDRGTGVYFKLRASRRTALEGSKPFVVVFRVPADWRVGLIQVDCRARGVRRAVVPPLKEEIDCGAERFLVAAYVEGDEPAKRAAREYARCESALRRVAQESSKSIDRHSLPSVAYKVGAALDLVDPRIPDDWLERILYSDSGRSLGRVGRYLPEKVRVAADEFLSAKRAVTEMASASSGRERVAVDSSS